MDLRTAYWIDVCAWLAWGGYWMAAARFVQRSQSSESVLMRMTHLLPLAAGFFLIFHGGDYSVIYGRLVRSDWIALLGTLVTIGGLLFAVWGRVHLGRYWSGIITLKEGHKLIRTGPYRFVRHPLYTGFLSAVLGSALVMFTGDACAGFAVILVAYIVKIRREETVLTGAFGDEYRQYRREVSALVPGVY